MGMLAASELREGLDGEEGREARAGGTAGIFFAAPLAGGGESAPRAGLAFMAE